MKMLRYNGVYLATRLGGGDRAVVRYTGETLNTDLYLCHVLLDMDGYFSNYVGKDGTFPFMKIELRRHYEPNDILKELVK